MIVITLSNYTDNLWQNRITKSSSRPNSEWSIQNHMKCLCETSFIATSLALNWNPITFADGLANLSAYFSAETMPGFALKSCVTSRGVFLINTWAADPRLSWLGETFTNLPKFAFSSSVAASMNCCTVKQLNILEVLFTDLTVATGPYVCKMAGMISVISNEEVFCRTVRQKNIYIHMKEFGKDVTLTVRVESLVGTWLLKNCCNCIANKL